MKFLRLLFLFIFILNSAQDNDGFQFQGHVKKEVIPFQLINNVIFIPLVINGVELTFMLDTGVAETLLFSLNDKEVNFNNVEKIKFSGLGGAVNIEGLRSVKNTVQIGKHLTDRDHTVFLILDEDFNISSYVGIPVNGIIGYQFFQNYPVKVDYVNKKITVFSDLKERETRRFSEIPITIELKKPYLYAGVQQVHENKNSKLLIDSGNSDALWLFPSLIPGFQYNRPNIEDFLGRGFNGDIFGKRSRINRFYLGDFVLEKPLMAMPDEFSIQHIRLAEDRKGSVGGEILKRFTVIYDYQKQRIYLRRNRFYNTPFHFNMSGLDIKHDGMLWDTDIVEVKTPASTFGDKISDSNTIVISNSVVYKFTLKPTYSVAGIRKDSPAGKAGIQKGDKIIMINSKKAGDMELREIYDLMKSEEGKKINLEMLRNGISLKFRILLEDPIPYTEKQ